MIELIVTLVMFGSGVAANELSANPKPFTIERADCQDPESRGELRRIGRAERN